MHRIYLAASFSRQNEIRVLADELAHMGFFVTSRWLYQEETNDQSYYDPESEPMPQHLAARYASVDIADVLASDTLVLFSNGYGAASKGGGRHVEFGIALALGRRLIVVGEKEHIFQELYHVEQYNTWEDAKKALVFGPRLTPLTRLAEVAPCT